MKRFLVLIPLVAVLLLGVGCYGEGGNKAADIQKTSQDLSGEYQSRLQAAVPYPIDQMNYSLERQNLRERLLRFNDPNKLGYVYEMSWTGQVVAYYTIKGKVSSMDSQMTTADTLYCTGGGESKSCAVIRSPGDDGSWGPNEGGIFFFTTEGVMLEWNGLWQYSDAPLQINEAGLIVRYIPGSTPSNTSSTAAVPSPSP